MLTKIALFLLLLQNQHMPSVAPASHRPVDLSANLRTTVHDYHLSARNFVEALTHVASEFQIPMGIEWVSIPSARARINLSFKDATVEQVLQAIANSQPSVKITIERSIVHAFAPEMIPDRENPLKLNINEFEVHNVPAERAWGQLHEVVKQTLFPPKPQQGFGRGGGIAGSGFSNIDDPKISVTLKNATVEDVLDALALTSARKIWIATFSDARTLTAAGYRRTLGLWTNSPAPDDEQPVWDMLHWGDAIP
jgi:hypothetical protein